MSSSAKVGLDATETPVDLDQSPADLVVLSFSDSDLGAFAAGWHLGKTDLPTLRLANLVALKHPLSVDTYIDKALSHARGILIRLIGGKSYWDYGVQQVRTLAAEKISPLQSYQRMDGSTLSWTNVHASRIAASVRSVTQAAETARAALGQLALAAGLYVKPSFGPAASPCRGWTRENGVICPAQVACRIDENRCGRLFLSLTLPLPTLTRLKC